MPTSKDVAVLAGVSHTTVSRAFRGDVKLKDATYEKVMKAAKTLGYTPNLLAAGLKGRSSKTIGLIVSDITNPFFMIVAQRIEKLLNQNGYRLIISFDEGEAEKQQKAVQLMLAARVEAVIFAPVYTKTIPDYISAENKIIQLFGDVYKGKSSVRIDDDYGGFIACEYLMNHGHSNIMFLGGSDRKGGYDKALGRGAEVLNIDGDETQAVDEMKNRIAKEKPTAILAVGDRNARYCVSALKELGLSVPRDISLMVYDDLSWTQMMDITAVSHPLEALSEAVTNLLNFLLSGDESVSKLIYKPFINERSSVRSIK